MSDGLNVSPSETSPYATLHKAAGADADGKPIDSIGLGAVAVAIEASGGAAGDVYFEGRAKKDVGSWVPLLGMSFASADSDDHAHFTADEGQVWTVPLDGAFDQFRARLDWTSGVFDVIARQIGGVHVGKMLAAIDLGPVTIGTVDQGDKGTEAQAWFAQITDGVAGHGPALVTAVAAALNAKGLVVRPITPELGAAAPTPVPSGAVDVPAAIPATPNLRLVGYSITEKAAGAAEWRILHGATVGAGVELADITLAASEHEFQWLGPDGIAIPNGISLDRISGTASFVLYTKVAA